MKEKLFGNVNNKLKTAAFILAVGGMLLTLAMGIYSMYTTWQYIQYYGYGPSYMLTTVSIYLAVGFCVLVSAWALYAFAEMAENLKQIKDSFFEDFDESEWECDGSDCMNCDEECETKCDSDNHKKQDEDKQETTEEEK